MMKMLFFPLFVCISLLFGCEKNAEAVPDLEDEKFDVSFSVSYTSEKTDAATSVADTLKNFHYFIYNSEGYRIRSSADRQLIQSPTLVTVKENLPPGKYKYVFFASDKPLDTHIADTPGEISSFIYASTFNVYHKTVEVTVAEAKINQNVNLDRLNASLEIDLLDEFIPDNVENIQVTWFDNKYIDFDGVSFTPARKQKNISLTAAANIRKTEKLSINVFNTSTPLSIYISYVDKKGNYVPGREISSVKCFKNGKTTLSGYLFGPANAEFNSAVDLGKNTLSAAAL
ncbi:FimB/Mfa2 family fimbrial subunit [Paradesertivirga mongoliensis]|uniref:FimB/Mfa2 family fimbrial subunit n=1 Tax=Paradesertivirga mongoliensis TaxID=2100740 RepID=A0ABW4ZPL7_9SPHI|nr:FimB/Mfa2 family fimbrial subunit [Pedobacter mongoliensis]